MERASLPAWAANASRATGPPGAPHLPSADDSFDDDVPPDIVQDVFDELVPSARRGQRVFQRGSDPALRAFYKAVG